MRISNLGPRLTKLGFILIIVAIGSFFLARIISIQAGNGDAGMIMLPVIVFSMIAGPALLVIGLLLTKLKSEDYKRGRNIIIGGIAITAGSYWLSLYSSLNSIFYWSWFIGSGILVICIGVIDCVITRLKRLIR